MAGLLLNLTRGPDALYIVANALRSGARASVVAALGITAGCFVHIFAAALGVSALMAASSTAFTAAKWASAAYLVYVSGRVLLAHALAAQEVVTTNLIANCASIAWAGGLKRIFFQGIGTNTLNSKAALFFLALMPQFIAPDVSSKPLAFLLPGLLFNFNGLWVNVGWAVTAVTAVTVAWMVWRLSAVEIDMQRLERAAGLMFVRFGVRLALVENPDQESTRKADLLKSFKK